MSFSKSDKGPIHLRRVVQHLIPIAVNTKEDEKGIVQVSVVDSATPTVEGNSRQRRNAAGI